MIHHGLRGAPCDAVLPGGIHPVLDDIQIKTTQGDATILVQGLVDLVKFIIVVQTDNALLKFPGIRQYPAIQVQQFVIGNAINGGIKTIQVCQEITRGISDAPVSIGHAFQDLVRDAHLSTVIGGRDPQAQDIRAQGLDDFLGLNGIAQGFGHLSALCIDEEPMGQHFFIRCNPVDADGGQQRGLKPAAMLIGTLKV